MREVRWLLLGLKQLVEEETAPVTHSGARGAGGAGGGPMVCVAPAPEVVERAETVAGCSIAEPAARLHRGGSGRSGEGAWRVGALLSGPAIKGPGRAGPGP